MSKSISLSEQLEGVSLEAALLFSWCIPHLDAEGRMLGNAAAVKATAVPLRREITLKKLPLLLYELARAPKDDRGRPLVYWYEVQNRALLEFPGFPDHQRGQRKNREAKSRLPGHKHPDAKDLTPNSGVGPELVRSRSGVGPDELRLSEVKKYVSTSEISNGGSDRELPAGSALEGATPAEVNERRNQFLAGIRQLQAEESPP